MASLLEISEEILLAEAYYLILIAELRDEMRDTGQCNSDLLKKLTCLNRLIRALKWDIEDSVNDKTTTILYNMLVTEISDYSGSALAVSDLVVTPTPSPVEVITGPPGADGLSAYQIAVRDGFVGTVTQWLLSLIGKDGAPGPIGPDGQIIVAGNAANILSGTVPPTTEGVDDDWYIDTVGSILYGPKTDGVWPEGGIILNGLNGKSAYTIAVDNGFVGNVAEWLISLIGPPGEQGAPGLSAYEVAVANGFAGSQASWLASLKGTDGKSAYQSALDGGFIGSEAAWIASLNGTDGEDGANGKSAYQLAVEGGFVGTVEAWLISLNGTDGLPGADSTVPGPPGPASTEPGPQGLSAYQVAVNNGFIGTEAEWLLSLKGEPGGGDFEELNRDVAFTVVDAADNVMGVVTSNGVDTLELNSPTGAAFASFQEEEYTPEVIVIPQLNIPYTITNTEGLNLTVTFKNEAGTVLGTYTNGAGIVGEGGVKPLSGELLSVVLSSTGTGVDPVELSMKIRKDGVLFDPFDAIYKTNQTGILTTKYIRPTEFNEWTFEVAIVTTTVDEEEEWVDTPPVAVIRVVVNDNTLPLTSFDFYGDGSYDIDGHLLTYKWTFLDADAVVTPI